MGIVLLVTGIVSGSGGPVRGHVGPGRGRSFFWARTVARIGVRYVRGDLRLVSLRVTRFAAKRRFQRFTGRFRIEGWCGRRRCFRQEFDLPGLGRTAGFTARDDVLLSKFASGVTTQGVVTVPWPGCRVRLVVWDKVLKRKRVFSKPCRLFKRGRRKAGHRKSGP